MFLPCVSSHSDKIRLQQGVVNYFEWSCTISDIFNVVLELLAWNFHELSAISCNGTKDGQLLKVSLLEYLSLCFPFPILLPPLLFSVPIGICQLTLNTLSFLSSEYVSLLYYFFCFCLLQGYVLLWRSRYENMMNVLRSVLSKSACSFLWPWIYFILVQLLTQ